MSKQVPWENDLLTRKTDANYVYQLIKGRAKQHSGSVVINVDARWGQGKTYFLTNMYLSVLEKKHPAVKIDAWKYDYVDDPYTYVMAELDEYFETLLALRRGGTKAEKDAKAVIREKVAAVRANAGKLLWVGLKGAAKRAGRFVVAEGADEMIEVVEQYAPTSLANEAKGAIEDVEKHLVAVSDNIINAYIKKRLDDFSETKESLENFRDNLTHLIDLLATKFEMKMPMYIFVDELDRCRPTYAIQMLERIKHLFDIPNLAFVIATDTTSLSHSIKAVYGSEFDSRQYLQRFFHRTYKLPVATRKHIMEAMIIQSGVDLQMWSLPDESEYAETYARFFDVTSRKFGLSVRQAQQSIQILNDITYAADSAFPLEITFLYCLICQFIKEGEVSREQVGKVLETAGRFGSDWSGEGNINYNKIIANINTAAKQSLETAFRQSEKNWKSDSDVNHHYIYEFLRREYRVKSKSGTATGTQFSEYYDLINYAKNTYVEDEDVADEAP